jgi:hypothetical protein
MEKSLKEIQNLSLSWAPPVGRSVVTATLLHVPMLSHLAATAFSHVAHLAGHFPQSVTNIVPAVHMRLVGIPGLHHIATTNHTHCWLTHYHRVRALLFPPALPTPAPAPHLSLSPAASSIDHRRMASSPPLGQSA